MDIKSDFVSVEQDEFDGLTTIEHLRHCRQCAGKNEITFSWRRNIRPASDRMILDVEIKTSRPGCWVPSQLALLIDGQRLELKYQASKSSDYRGSSFYEIGMFFIEPSQETLRRLCDAKALKLKLRYAENNEYMVFSDEFCAQLQLQAQQFYNNTFDDCEYLSAVMGVAVRTVDTTFAEQIARRESRYQQLCNVRLLCAVLWGSFFGGLCVLCAFEAVTFSVKLTDQLIIAGMLSATSWLIPHLQIRWIEYQKNKECPNCHHRAIKLIRYHEAVYQVRSVERLVNDRLTGQRKSRQVTVTDHEVTQDFECKDCRYQWTRSHIARGF
jgi:hypothetical protein